MTDIDSPTVHSSLITAKLEEEAVEVGRRWEERQELEDMLVILGTYLHLDIKPAHLN